MALQKSNNDSYFYNIAFAWRYSGLDKLNLIEEHNELYIMFMDSVVYDWKFDIPFPKDVTHQADFDQFSLYSCARHDLKDFVWTEEYRKEVVIDTLNNVVYKEVRFLLWEVFTGQYSVKRNKLIKKLIKLHSKRGDFLGENHLQKLINKLPWYLKWKYKILGTI